ncbi:MAG: DUF1127 domain-containing protein [Pseudomonadota bacterium]
MRPNPNAAARRIQSARQAGSPGAASLLDALCRRWRVCAQVARERRALRELSDHQLRDLGLSRADVEREAHRPFWDAPRRRG